IVQEAQGNPFLALQLAALAQAKLARGDADIASLSIDALVAQTSDLLPDDAKKLLAVLAVAGRPVAVRLVLQATGIQQSGRALVRVVSQLYCTGARATGRGVVGKAGAITGLLRQCGGGCGGLSRTRQARARGAGSAAYAVRNLALHAQWPLRTGTKVTLERA